MGQSENSLLLTQLLVGLEEDFRDPLQSVYFVGQESGSGGF